MAALATRFSNVKIEAFLPLFLRLAQIALLLLIGWTLMRAILLWMNPESAWRPTPQVNLSPNEVVNSAEIQNFEFNTDPFKVTTSADELSTTAVNFDPNIDVPETSLDISVTGWIAGVLGSATLRTPDNREASYKIGEEVMNNVTLQAVTGRYVVLDVSGDLQRLTFDREGEASLIGTPRTGEGNIKTTGERPAPDLSGRPINASDLLKVVRLNPKFDQGRLVGHVIQSRGDETVLSGLGLQSGDIVTAINGKSLIQGRLDLQELALTLQNAGTVRLDIERNGRVKTVKIGQ